MTKQSPSRCLRRDDQKNFGSGLEKDENWSSDTIWRNIDLLIRPLHPSDAKYEVEIDDHILELKTCTAKTRKLLFLSLVIHNESCNINRIKPCVIIFLYSTVHTNESSPAGMLVLHIPISHYLTTDPNLSGWFMLHGHVFINMSILKRYINTASNLPEISNCKKTRTRTHTSFTELRWITEYTQRSIISKCASKKYAAISSASFASFRIRWRPLKMHECFTSFRFHIL